MRILDHCCLCCCETISRCSNQLEIFWNGIPSRGIYKEIVTVLLHNLTVLVQKIVGWIVEKYMHSSTQNRFKCGIFGGRGSSVWGQ